MTSHRAVALAGALLVLSSTPAAFAAQGCGPDEDHLHTVPWPEQLGGAPSKMLAAALFQPNAQELLVLSDGQLSMVRDPMSAPRVVQLASDVRDFTVLPPFDGLSQVAITTDNGLYLSTITSLDGTQGSSLKFTALAAAGSWCNADKLDAASDGNQALIVGVQGTTVLRGKVTSTGQFNSVASIPYGFAITHLAAADAHSTAGVEVAVGDDYSLSFYLESSTTVSYVTPIVAPTGFLQVARIPLGADVRDSFGIIERHPTTDSLRELVDTTFSDPIYSSGLRVSYASFGAIGTQTLVPFAVGPTDMIFAATSGDFLALHGHPQAGGGMPMGFDFYNWSVLGLSSYLEGSLLTSMFSVADFDGDGDGDLAVWGDGNGEAYVAFVRNDCNVDPTVATVQMLAPQTDPFLIDSGGGYSLTAESELGVDVTLEVRQPPIFDGEIPTHVQVKIYVREYYAYSSPPYPIQPDVLPDVWWEDILVVTPGTTTPTVTPHTAELLFAPLQLPVTVPLDPEDSGQLTPENTILYFELIPQIRTGSGSGAQSGDLVQRGNPTIWVGSARASLLRQLICKQEPDEFSPSFVCNGTAPHVTYVHRHKVIRYIPPQTTP